MKPAKLLPKRLRHLARRSIENLGFIHASAGPADLHAAMKRRADVVVETVIDVGASTGRWSERMMQHYPAAKYLLVEAQEAPHREALQLFRASHANVQYELCAAGDRDGEIYFDASSPIGGAASNTPFARNNIVVRMARLDTLVRQNALRGPFLLKLDTHGFEVPILEGAAESVLPQASMLIIEAYNFTLRPGALRFHELCGYLEKRNLRCADMFDVMLRPVDQVIWQMDMVFLPSAHPVFELNEFDFTARQS
jgi:FkbM family methyltransferase